MMTRNGKYVIRLDTIGWIVRQMLQRNCLTVALISASSAERINMSDRVISKHCIQCGKPFESEEQAYYISPCVVTKTDIGYYRLRENEVRVKFPGGRNKLKCAMCVECFSLMLGD